MGEPRPDDSNKARILVVREMTGRQSNWQTHNQPREKVADVLEFLFEPLIIAWGSFTLIKCRVSQGSALARVKGTYASF